MTEQFGLVTDSVVEVPSWFGPADRPLFGWFVYPTCRVVRGAVVLCQPFAEEGNMAYRTFRTLSQRLAREGFLTLRFDYDGTGDSAGSFEDPGRAAAWVASVRYAVEEVRRWGAQQVSLVGMRLGATVAYTAAADCSLGLDDLILWDPCAAGWSFLRELQMLHSPWLEGRIRAPDGWIETPSYRFSPSAVTDVRSLVIHGRVRVAELARRTTVLIRPDRADPRALRTAIPSAEAQWAEALGQAELLDVPTLDAAVPALTVSEVVSRLTVAAAPQSTVIVPRSEIETNWREPGHSVREEARFFGPDGLLFGVQTSPVSDEDSPGPRVLFLNVSTERHLGEGRLWVTLARALAGEGITSVRLDHGGVGDSGTRPGRGQDTVYDTGWLEDVPNVAHALSGSGRPNVVAVGLCSSGSSAMEAALRGSVREAIAINTFLTLDANESPPAEWATFRRIPPWLTQLAMKHRRASNAIWRAWSCIDPRCGALWASRVIVGMGSAVTLVVGDDDLYQVRQSPLWRVTWGRRLTRSDSFRIQRVPNADHSLRVGSGQDEVGAAIMSRLRTISGPAQ